MIADPTIRRTEMITLVQYPRAFGLPNPSPFCMKAEILLKMSGLDYAVETTPDPRKAPKGKLPAIRDDGRVIGDSEMIRKHLETAYGVEFDRGLDARARAVAHAFCRMVEERTYWTVVHSRWVDAANWPTIRRQFFRGLPPVIRTLVPIRARQHVLAELRGHGIGRHAAKEIYDFGIADIRAVAAWLGDKPFFMGDTPTGADATIYAFLAGVAEVPLGSPMKDEALKHDTLMAYSRHCRDRWFPEMP